MIFFKSYSNSFLATIISIFASLALLGGAIALISFFTGGMKYPENIVWGIALIAVWFGCSKLAAFIAKKKG